MSARQRGRDPEPLRQHPGIVPLLGLAPVDLRVVGRVWPDGRRLMLHAGLVGLFLVVAHVAMIFGMLDPSVLWAAVGGTAHGGAAH